jgi:hypothetical protein
MTPEQVAKRMGYTYALIGGGIACLYTAYEYTIPPSGRAEPTPDWVPYLFGILGVVLLIAGIVLALKLKKEPTPAAKTDLSGPQGKKVVVLMAIGFAALACTWVTGYILPAGNDILAAAVSVVLIVFALVCLLSAARIGRRIRQAAPTGAAKE